MIYASAIPYKTALSGSGKFYIFVNANNWPTNASYFLGLPTSPWACEYIAMVDFAIDSDNSFRSDRPSYFERSSAISALNTIATRTPILVAGSYFDTWINRKIKVKKGDLIRFYVADTALRSYVYECNT